MNSNQIRARLIEKGRSFRQFAMEHGYNPRNVTQVVARWAGETRLPNGRQAFAILHDLSLEVGEELIHGLLSDDERKKLGPEAAESRSGNGQGETRT